ncbi:MAG: signal peptidase I, partial [Bacillota bacterium]|nr:signal peptidase I [Bacillota bacterium]
MKQEKRKEVSVKDDVLFLVLKILIFAVLLAVTFLFLFGICRISDNMMAPAFKDGDLAVYYRLQKEYQPS